MAAPPLAGAGPAAGAPPVPDPARRARTLGLAGALLMAVGSLGSGALPVPNPLFGLRLLGLPSRNATLAIAVTYCGMVMVVLAWLWIGRMLRTRGAVAPAPNRFQLARTGLLWALPLALAPPMFTRDVYSYLAQSATLDRGLDPYVLGPADALGVDDPLTRSIPNVWRNTPAPYGPLFLTAGRLVNAVAGDDIVLGVLSYRVFAVIGMIAVVWALPRLAARCGLDGGLALWLGAANPLVLFHLVSGLHNEALMLGLMLVGLELGLRAGTRLADPYLIGGALIIIVASAVKLPALLALSMLGIAWAQRRGGRIRDVALAAGLCLGLTVAVYLPLSVGLGVGLGWLTTLAIPSLVISWMSLITDLGLFAGQVGVFGGLGDHTTAVLALTRTIGLAGSAVVVAVLALAVLRGRLDPLTATGAGLGAVVLLGPVVHPWYLLWAVIPLAASRGMPRYRRVTLAASAVLALSVPPTGADFNFRVFQLPLAMLAALGMLFVLFVTLWRGWSRAEGPDIDVLPGRHPARLGEQRSAPVTPAAGP